MHLNKERIDIFAHNVIDLKEEYLKLLKTQKLAAPDEGWVDLGAIQTVIQATEQETVKRIIIIKKRVTPVSWWKKCLSGNTSCLSLSFLRSHTSLTHSAALSRAYAAAPFQNTPEIIHTRTAAQEDMTFDLPAQTPSA